MAANDDGRFAEVLLAPDRAELRRRLPPLLGGIVAIGIAIGLSVRSELGVAPWDVLHQGLADVTGVSFGAVVVIVGLLVLLTWIPLRQRPGIGTLVNTLSIGFVADATLAIVPEVESLAARVAFLVLATLTFGIGGGLYIGAGLGPGPRDGLMTGLAARGHRLWVVRTALEVSVLVAGWLLGGTVGVGTVLIALTLGPLTHAALERFHLPVHAPTAEVLAE